MSQWGARFLLLALLLGLGGYTYFYEIKGKEKRLEQEIFGKMLWPKSGPITTIKIQAGDTLISAQKNNGQWQLSAPVEDLAQHSEWEGLVKTLENADYTSVVQDPVKDWSVFGFLPPLGKITVNEKLTYHVGTRENFKGKPYLRVNEESRVLLVGTEWKKILTTEPRKWRDNRLFRGSPTDIESVELKKQGKSLLRFQLNGAVWNTESPVRIDVKLVENWLRDIRKSRIHQFMSEEVNDPKILAQYDLDKPEYEIVMQLKGGQRWRANVSPLVNDQRYVVVDGRDTVFWVKNTIFKEALKKRLRDFWSRSIAFEFEEEGIDEVEILQSSRNQLLKPNDVRWEKVKGLISSIKKLKIEEFYPESTRWDVKGRFLKLKKGPETLFQMSWDTGKKENRIKLKTSVFDRVVEVKKSEFDKLKLSALAEIEEK